MKAVFLKTIREKRNLLIILCIVSMITLWMYVALFPTFSKQSGEYEKLLASFPKELWEVFGMESGNLSFNTLEKFISVEMYSLLWPILSIIFFTNIGIAQIGGETEKGTLEILLSQPISRVKLFISKYLGGALLITILCFVSVYSTILIAAAYNIEYKIGIYHKLFLTGLLFCLSGFSITMLLSTIFEKGKATLIGVGIYLVMYIMTILSTLKDSLKDLQYLSFFHYLDTSEVLTKNIINNTASWFFLL